MPFLFGFWKTAFEKWNAAPEPASWAAVSHCDTEREPNVVCQRHHSSGIRGENLPEINADIYLTTEP